MNSYVKSIWHCWEKVTSVQSGGTPNKVKETLAGGGGVLSSSQGSPRNLPAAPLRTVTVRGDTNCGELGCCRGDEEVGGDVVCKRRHK